MSFQLEYENDGSISLYIDGYLQFNSRDERIYHECLGLPGISLACSRFIGEPLEVLICGGGDGLLARELLKCRQVRSITVVDLDVRIIDLAKTQLRPFNESSLQDPRVSILIEDAWRYVEEAPTHYHAIFADLTVPQDDVSARNYTVEWFDRLRRLLVDQRGIVVSNCASPSQTPAAYWSIINSCRAGGLSVRPYRTCVPSFTESGYGPDWGFLLASLSPVSREELARVDLPEPRLHLADPKYLFAFPDGSADYRLIAKPNHAIRNDLVRNLNLVAETHGDPWLAGWNALDWDHDAAHTAGAGNHLKLFENNPSWQAGSSSADSAGNVVPQREQRNYVEEIAQRLFGLMPELKSTRIFNMIEEFVSCPERFLNTIHLPAVIEELQKRTVELPAEIQQELEHLRQQLPKLDLRNIDFECWESRLLSIIALVIILANLASPDMVYAKSFFHPHVPNVQAPIARYGPNTFMTGPAFRMNDLGDWITDVNGNVYPGRQIRLHSADYCNLVMNGSQLKKERPQSLAVSYRLTPDTVLTERGDVLLELSPNVAMLINQHSGAFIDLQHGQPILSVGLSPVETNDVAEELNEQIDTLQNSLVSVETQTNGLSALGLQNTDQPDRSLEIANLTTHANLLRTARATLPAANASEQQSAQAPTPGSTAETETEAEAQDVLPGAFSLLPSLWVRNDGRCAVIRLPDYSLAYLNGRAWFSDPEMTKPLSAAYPKRFRKFLISYLQNDIETVSQRVGEQREEQRQLDSHLGALSGEQSELEKAVARAEGKAKQDLHGPQGGNVDRKEPPLLVPYGPEYIPLHQALAHVTSEIADTIHRLAESRKESQACIDETPAFEQLLHHLRKKD